MVSVVATPYKTAAAPVLSSVIDVRPVSETRGMEGFKVLLKGGGALIFVRTQF